MLSSQEEQAERRRVFAQDQSLRNQGSTFHQHALADAETPRGRFSAVSAAHVVGSKAGIASSYPAASSAHQTELPPEPALGYRVDELEPLAPPVEAQAPGPTSDDPSPLGRGVGLLSRIGDPAREFPSPPGTSSDVNAGSLPLRRRRL